MTSEAAPITTGPALNTTPAGEPTLHHLNDSQSQRVLWLLEELAIPYKVELYKRVASGADKSRAPKELANVHVSGKSPILVTADGKTISESTTICAYLIKTYDTAGKFTADDWVRDDSLCSFAGASLGTSAMIKLILEIAGTQGPLLARPLLKAVGTGINKQMTGPELKKNLQYLQDQLGDADWFGGSHPMRADFILSFPLDIVEQRKWANLEKDFPKLYAFHQRVLARPAWKAGLEKGNGYDLSSF